MNTMILVENIPFRNPRRRFLLLLLSPLPPAFPLLTPLGLLVGLPCIFLYSRGGAGC